MTIEIITKYENAKKEYLDRLVWNNLSSATVSNYETTLRLFGGFLRDTDADDLYEAVEMWKETMLCGGNAPSTVNERLVTLGIFFSKACKKSFPKQLRYADNPVEEVELCKVVKRPYAETLTDEQIKKLYANKPYKGARLWARTYAMIQLLLSEKLRNSELTSLALADVDLYYREITVRHGKGDKFRIVDMSGLTAEALTAYLESGIRPANLADTDYLFGSMQGGKWAKMSRQGLSSLVARHIKEVCGVDADVRSHALRHVGARISLNAGASLEQLQGELGHAQMSTTTIYSGRVLQRRRREGAKDILAFRDEQAEKLHCRNESQQLQIRLLKEA